MADATEQSPVSYRLQVRNLPPKGTTVTLDANPEQRAALARAHGLLSVERFWTELLARRWKGDGTRVIGKVEADITQACIVTLEPVVARIDEEVSAIFVPEGSRLARIEDENGEILLQADGDDLPEVFEGDSIDLGALAEEFFALGIDPYPRKEGSALELPSGKGEPERGPLYDALKKLKGNG
jgi:uncharacterized metal-binding protein YceD (DUF177 family)